MFKRTLTAIVLGLAVASHAALAADTDSTGADRSQTAEKRGSQPTDASYEYWKQFNDADRIYDFTP